MHPYPHTYSAVAAGDPAGLVVVTSLQLPHVQSAPPPGFDGPGGVWSSDCGAFRD